MPRIIRRGHAARAVVLLVVTGAALAWTLVVPAPSRAPAPARTSDVALAPAAAGAPAVQTVLPGAALAPVAVPPRARPARHHQAHRKHAHHRRAKARHHRRHRAHAGHAVRRAPDPWRSKGGRDIGWPQCPSDVGFRGHNGLGQPMPDQGVEFVIIGLTNGRSFTPNPCLDLHLGWVRSHHVEASAYAFAAYPSRGQLRRLHDRGPYDGRHLVGALANVGLATAQYNVRTMQAHGFTTPHVWLDVEPSSSNPWSHNRARNRAVVSGWLRGYREAGYTVGIYSTSRLWHSILGRFRPGLPEWRTAGPVRPRAALRACSGPSIQGGQAVLAQWWTTHRDFDRICPGPSRSDTMARYFHQW